MSTPSIPPPGEPLLRRLRAALAGRYEVERELDRGGMGTVFLAKDPRHARRVALKVLHPELSHALGVERFLREIRAAGGLTHPNILPLHDSGEADGLLFYIMPYVEGESLRARLRREGRLPVAEALRIAQETADALAYAHGSGILHRDIKPENILLSPGSHAVLADFGLARAVHSAASRRITPTGIALGSPLYMSPEQAAGVKEVDGRSDVYSLGCVLYEMLAGEPPFPGPTAGAVIRSKLEGEPRPLRRVRPEVPAAVERTIRRALERRPERRFADAGELLAALRPLPPSDRPPAWKSGAVAAGGLLLALLVTFVGVRFYRSTTLVGLGALDPARPLLLADFEAAVPRDSALARMAGVLLRIDLSQSRLISLVGEGRVRDGLTRMQRTPEEPLDHELARELAIREGLPAVILPRIVATGDRYVLIAEVVAAEPAEVLAAADVIASDTADLIRGVGELSGELRRRVGETFSQLRRSEPLAQVTTRSLPALRKYTRAIEAMDDGDYGTAITLLEETIALDSTFASAYRSLGLALYNQEEHWDRSLEMYRRAYELRDRLPERERYRAVASYREAIGDWEGAVRAYQLHLEAFPGSTEVINNIGHTYSEVGDGRRAVDYYERAWRADTLESLYGSNLVQALHSIGETDRAAALNRRLLERFPDFPNIPNDASLIAAARGDYAGAERWTREVREAWRDDVSWRIWTALRLGYLAATQGRLAEAERHFQQAMREEISRGTPTGAFKVSVILAGLDAHARLRPREAVERIEAALERHPLEGLAFPDRRYPELAWIYAAAGRPDRIRALVAEMEAGTDPQMARIAERFRPRMRAALAAAEGRHDDAVAALRESAPDACTLCSLPLLGGAFERAEQPDSAVAVYERYLASTYIYRIEPDAAWLARVHERLAELYAGRGRQAEAAEHHAALVRLWADADPELRPRVAAAERRLAQLRGAGADRDP